MPARTKKPARPEAAPEDAAAAAHLMQEARSRAFARLLGLAFTAASLLEALADDSSSDREREALRFTADELSDAAETLNALEHGRTPRWMVERDPLDLLLGLKLAGERHRAWAESFGCARDVPADFLDRLRAAGRQLASEDD